MQKLITCLLIGIKQAHAVGKVLKDTIFHQAYSSDLKRANKTCQIIMEENQRSSIKSNDIHGMFLEWWNMYQKKSFPYLTIFFMSL